MQETQCAKLAKFINILPDKYKQAYSHTTAVGATPKWRLNAVEKCEGFLNPTSVYTSIIFFFPDLTIS